MQPFSAATRLRNIEHLKTETFDVLILGGGINGAGVARDLAIRIRRGRVPLRVGLVEQYHFASGTSGKNSQLIHGGLRYLKYLQLGLVRESLRERAILLRLAPHLVKPLSFLIPMYGRFARFYYGTGLRLYDLLAGARIVGRHRRLSLQEVKETEPGLFADGLTGGAVFYDCKVHSARFVLENILEAARNRVAVANYVRAERPGREGGHLWSVNLVDTISGERFSVRTRKIVDARGPWGEEGTLRLVRGSHLVLPRVNASEHAIAHFDEQGRIVFLIPWGAGNDLTLVGTTDVDHQTGPDNVRISNDEAAYLLGIIGKLFPCARGLQPVAAYSSLRPLLRHESGSPAAASREHRIWTSRDGIVHIAGGKYTTYRLMSEEAADMVTADIAPVLSSFHLTAETPLEESAWAPIEELALEAQVERAVEYEMAQRLADFLFVSTYAGYERKWDAESLRPFAEEMGRRLGWDHRRMEAEVALVLRIASLPGFRGEVAQ